jgi:hypothetical protein
MTGFEIWLKRREKGEQKMSDSLVAEEGKEFERELPPAGPINAVFWKWFDVGLQFNQKFGTSSRTVVLAWETDYRYQTGEWKDKRWICYQKYTLSMGEKSYLRRDIQNWRGRKFDPAEPKDASYFVKDENGKPKLRFDLKNLKKGTPALITLVHNGGYANMAAISKLPQPPYTSLTVETPDDVVPAYVVKLLEKQVASENQEEIMKIAEQGFEAGGKPPSRQPTEEEKDVF